MVVSSMLQRMGLLFLWVSLDLPENENNARYDVGTYSWRLEKDGVCNQRQLFKME